MVNDLINSTMKQMFIRFQIRLSITEFSSSFFILKKVKLDATSLRTIDDG